MNPNTKTAVAVAAGTVLAALYFQEGERGIPRESSCTYMAPWTTDVAAWGAGAVLVFLGAKHESPTISFLGAAIATLHIAQFAAHKVITREPKEVIIDAIAADHQSDVDAYEASVKRAILVEKAFG